VPHPLPFSPHPPPQSQVELTLEIINFDHSTPDGEATFAPMFVGFMPRAALEGLDLNAPSARPTWQAGCFGEGAARGGQRAVARGRGTLVSLSPHTSGQPCLRWPPSMTLTTPLIKPGWWTGGRKGYAIYDGSKARHPCSESLLWAQGDHLEVRGAGLVGAV
jgi:hypothetical protein